jgi:hypothetical protein
MTRRRQTPGRSDARTRRGWREPDRRWWARRRLAPLHVSNALTISAAVVVGALTGWWILAIVVGSVYAIFAAGLLALAISRRVANTFDKFRG